MRITDLSPRTPLAALLALAVAACGGQPGMDGMDGPAPSGQTAEAPAPAPETTAAPAGGASLADGVYTDEQAERGYLVFRDTCAECHGENEMHGSDFLFEWEGSSVGRLYRVISRTMPDDDPGSLPTENYVDVVTYILQLNDFPAGATELTADEERLNALTIEK